MTVVGEVDGGAGTGDTDGDTDTDSDTTTSTGSDTGPDECTWFTEPGGQLYSVWGASADSVFAVGGTYDVASIAISYDGSGWSALPDHLYGLIALRGVWGASADDVFVVCEALFMLRYQGSEWDSYLVDINAFSAVWGSSAGNVYAVGGFPFWPFPPAVSRFDGADWISDVSVPGLILFDVWGSSASNVYAVGLNTLLHSSGTGWSEVDTGPISIDEGMMLQGVWGSSSADVWVVGTYVTDGPVLLYYDGGQWQDISLGGIVWSEVDYEFPFPLNDVWVAPTGEVFTVGDEGAVYCVY
jgi:hypothetical protein